MAWGLASLDAAAPSSDQRHAPACRAVAEGV